MRRRRTAEAADVAVTGAATPLGRALLARLTGQEDAPPVRAVDDAAADLVRQLTGVRSAVHCGLSYDVTTDGEERRRRNVDGTARLLTAAREAGVLRVVLVTSLDVHASPPPGSGVPLPEDLPLRAEGDRALTGDLLEVERLADHATRTGLEVLVLRPAALVGGPLGPEYDGSLLHALSAPRLLAVRGVEPLWQLCHSDDLLSALALAATGTLTGAAAVASEGWLPQREVERLARRRRVELPAAVALSTAERLHRAGLTPGSAAELDRLVSPLVVEPRRLTQAGWTPTWTAAAALAAHLEGREAGTHRVGTYTAAGAGATVALLGSAALVRRARRRRGRGR